MIVCGMPDFLEKKANNYLKVVRKFLSHVLLDKMSKYTSSTYLKSNISYLILYY